MAIAKLLPPSDRWVSQSRYSLGDLYGCRNEVNTWTARAVAASHQGMSGGGTIRL